MVFVFKSTFCCIDVSLEGWRGDPDIWEYVDFEPSSGKAKEHTASLTRIVNYCFFFFLVKRTLEGQGREAISENFADIAYNGML